MTGTLTLIILAVLAIAMLAVVVPIITKRKAARDIRLGPVTVEPDLMDPALWEIGGVSDMDSSKGVEPHPHAVAGGWAFDIPQPNAEAGHVHYVTIKYPTLKGKSVIKMRGRIEAADGTTLHPTKYPTSPASIALYFQVYKDSWGSDGNRWWATFQGGHVANLAPGEFELVAPLDANWTSVMTMTREADLKTFELVRDTTGRVGFTFGGGDGWGHGLFASAPAKFVCTSFEVE